MVDELMIQILTANMAMRYHRKATGDKYRMARAKKARKTFTLRLKCQMGKIIM